MTACVAQGPIGEALESMSACDAFLLAGNECLSDMCTQASACVHISHCTPQVTHTSQDRKTETLCEMAGRGIFIATPAGVQVGGPTRH